jgi:hypothetical protein
MMMIWNHQEKKRRKKIDEKLIKNFLFHINHRILNENEGKNDSIKYFYVKKKFFRLEIQSFERQTNESIMDLTNDDGTQIRGPTIQKTKWLIN